MNISFSLKITALGLALSSVAFAQSPVPTSPAHPPVPPDAATALTSQQLPDEHWGEEVEEHSSILTGIYQNARNSATKTFKTRAYHQDLEFVRTADALALVKQHGSLKLESGRKNLQLKSA